VDVLAQPTRGTLRNKDAELKEALAGQLEPVYRVRKFKRLLKQRFEADQAASADSGIAAPRESNPTSALLQAM